MHLASVKATLIIPVMPLQPPSLEFFPYCLADQTPKPGFPRSPWPGAGEKDQQQQQQRRHRSSRLPAVAHTLQHARSERRSERTDLPNTPRHTGDAVKLNNPTSGRARANTVDQIGTDKVCRKAPMWMYKHNVTHRHTHKHNVGGGGGGEGECPLSPELLDQHCQTSSLLKCHNVWDLLYHAQTHTSSTQVHTHFFFF